MSLKKNATVEIVATKAKQVSEPLVYVGPTILGVSMSNTTYNNGLPEELKKAIKEVPAMGNLVVSAEKLSAALSDIQNKKGAMYAFYEKALNYSTMKGDK